MSASMEVGARGGAAAGLRRIRQNDNNASLFIDFDAVIMRRRRRSLCGLYVDINVGESCSVFIRLSAVGH